MTFQFRRQEGKWDQRTLLWLGHCAFHAGEYSKAVKVYEQLTKEEECSKEVYVYLACAFFYLGMYLDAKEAAEKGAKSALQNRILFHVSHKLEDEKRLMLYHSQLQDSIEDQLSLASIHYLRFHYQEAIDIYKKILTNNKTFIALNVYLALCYYRLDYYDVSLEVLQNYLNEYPDSATAVNLRACNQYKLYNGKAAERELNILKDQTSSSFRFARDIIMHNTVVFRNGDAALQVLPSLVDVVPESRLNLIIFHMRRDDIRAALSLVSDLDPQVPNEFLLKAITYCIIGYEKQSKDHLKTAEQCFKLVGESSTECDTIIGRQAMASAYFLMRQFDEVLVYLNSIKSYFYNDDVFNFNIAQALIATGNTNEAEASLLLINDPQLKMLPTYTQNLARAYVRNGKANLAWELYNRTKQSKRALDLLKIIANDCYKKHEYYYSAKAFDEMERIEPSPEYWEGKRGAVAGVFKMFIDKKATIQQLREALIMLEKSRHSQVEPIATVIRRFCRERNAGL
ncbi:hypothetical protein AB6A40_006724 [Gnathostoma spinigerum]|uniref:Intraflagellar transport protein 56 n=1 Tax=Gnathostoma spinigerum TaxID=75299 RepID=A0ABD6EJ62_9BILA